MSFFSIEYQKRGAKCSGLISPIVRKFTLLHFQIATNVKSWCSYGLSSMSYWNLPAPIEWNAIESLEKSFGQVIISISLLSRVAF